MPASLVELLQLLSVCLSRQAGQWPLLYPVPCHVSFLGRFVPVTHGQGKGMDKPAQDDTSADMHAGKPGLDIVGMHREYKPLAWDAGYRLAGGHNNMPQAAAHMACMLKLKSST